MNEKRINDTYYVGFEGQVEIQLIYESSNKVNILKLWNGYFETLLDLMCMYASLDEGILYEYCSQEGWYEESKWRIQDLNSTITLFESFDVNRLTDEQMERVRSIVPTLPYVTQQISIFLKKAASNGCEVYIEYDGGGKKHRKFTNQCY